MPDLNGIVILIPSLEPDDRLPAYTVSLREQGFAHIVIVDDGSSAKAQPVFDTLERGGCTVLHHEVNRGKGAALRTGYAYIRDSIPSCTCVITADADGQHTVPDCLRMAQAMEGRDKPVLLLGSRDFNQPDVPPKSRFGNKITSVIFRGLYGCWLPDTQTGLRAFRREELDFMLAIDGDRYEYEMKVLIACARAKIPMETLTITTVYENNNEGTHFHPIRDSWRIYRVIFGNFFRFMSASLVCFLVDQVLANLLSLLILPLLGVTGAAMLSNISGYGARIVSAILNYTLNRKFVFEEKGSFAGSAVKYFLLCLLIITMSNWAVAGLTTLKVPYTIAKILCDTLMYFLSYTVQRRWVFQNKEADK